MLCTGHNIQSKAMSSRPGSRRGRGADPAIAVRVTQVGEVPRLRSG